MSERSFQEDLSAARFEELARVLSDPEAAISALPEEERRRYAQAQQSVIDSAVWVRPKGM